MVTYQLSGTDWAAFARIWLKNSSYKSNYLRPNKNKEDEVTVGSGFPGFSRFPFLSDYLTDLKLHRTINFVKNFPHWGLNSQPPDHHSNALPTEWGRNLLGHEISEVSFVCFMHHFTFWTLFTSRRINRACLYKGLNESCRQPNSDLAQLVEY